MVAAHFAESGAGPEFERIAVRRSSTAASNDQRIECGSSAETPAAHASQRAQQLCTSIGAGVRDRFGLDRSAKRQIDGHSKSTTRLANAVQRTRFVESASAGKKFDRPPPIRPDRSNARTAWQIITTNHNFIFRCIRNAQSVRH